ncbi:MAG: hypothetical protein WBG90_05130 [Saonia sp.]
MTIIYILYALIAIATSLMVYRIATDHHKAKRLRELTRQREIKENFNCKIYTKAKKI